MYNSSFCCEHLAANFLPAENIVLCLHLHVCGNPLAITPFGLCVYMCVRRVSMAYDESNIRAASLCVHTRDCKIRMLSM